MLVVADSSPLIALINIDHVDILPRLFGQIIIPREVFAELAHEKRPECVRSFMAAKPAWLMEQSPSSIEPIPMLHPGEASAISLALEIHADLLLIDEMLGRKAAASRGIRVTGTVGILEKAADERLIDLENAFEKLKQTDFWISPELLDTRLRQFLQRRK